MIILLLLSFVTLIFNVSSEIILELPIGLTLGGDLVAVIPTGILGYFIYREYNKRKAS